MSDKAAGWKEKGAKSEEAGRQAGRGELAPAKLWGRKSLISCTSILTSSSSRASLAGLSTDQIIRIWSLGN